MLNDGAFDCARPITVANFGNGTTIGHTAAASSGTFSGAITLSKAVALNAAAGQSETLSGQITGTGAVSTTGGTVVLSSSSNDYARRTV